MRHQAASAGFSVERIEYSSADLLLRVVVRAWVPPQARLAPALLVEYGEVRLCYSPLVACWSCGTGNEAAAGSSAPAAWRWRAAFAVPPEVAGESTARFSLRLHGELVLDAPAPGEPTHILHGLAARRRRSVVLKGTGRGVLMLLLSGALVFGVGGGSGGALAAGPGSPARVSEAATSAGEVTTTTVTPQTLTGGEEERSTATIPQQVTPSEPAPGGNGEGAPQPPPTTTSSTAQTVSPDTEPAPPSTGAGTSAAPPAQPKGASTAPVSSGTGARKTHHDAAAGAPASPRPAAAEGEDEPAQPSELSPETGVLSPQLRELTGLLDGVEEGPPAFLVPIYEAAGRRYDVPWRVLAAINAVETDYGRDLSVSTAGAVGWMQFMPETWAQWAVDADSDGEKNPYSPQDAIFTAARYLQASGAEHDLAGAIFAYNHAQWYVTEVLLRAHLLANTASFARLEKGYSLPLERRYMNTLGRTDDGVDIETAPDGALVYSITPGIVTAVASDPAGFGPNYPVVRATAGALEGQNIYYGHVAVSLVHPGEVVAAGQPIAIMGHAGDAASLGHGHIEIGFSDAGGDPLSHHGAGAWTPSGDLMRAFLVALSSSFGVHNE